METRTAFAQAAKEWDGAALVEQMELTMDLDPDMNLLVEFWVWLEDEAERDPSTAASSIAMSWVRKYLESRRDIWIDRRAEELIEGDVDGDFELEYGR